MRLSPGLTDDAQACDKYASPPPARHIALHPRKIVGNAAAAAGALLRCNADAGHRMVMAVEFPGRRQGVIVDSVLASLRNNTQGYEA